MAEIRSQVTLESVRALRQTYWANGYRPVAIWSPGACDQTGQPIRGAGKRPQGEDWLQRALSDPPHAVTASVSSLALNTGLAAGEITAVDIDILVPELARDVAHRVEHVLGPTPLDRIGRAPKRLLVYRAERPLAKLTTTPLFLPDGTKVLIEILGLGQQFVCDGIHPDTGQPYSWTNGSPADTPLADLPVVGEEMLHDTLDEIERMLGEAGAVEKKTSKPSRPPRRQTGRTTGGGFFHHVNVAALAGPERWVQALHPDFRDRGNSGWRLTSEDLGRDLEEDISVHPDGIWDFGLEIALTAIDLVIQLGGTADALAAARWLCERLGVSPESLGWRERGVLGLDDLNARTDTSDDTEPGAGGGKRPPLPDDKPAPSQDDGSAGPSVALPRGDGGGDGGGGGGAGGGAALPPPEPGEDDDPGARVRRGVSLNDLFSVMTETRYLYIPNRTFWPADKVNGRFGHIPVRLAGGQRVKIKASRWLDMHRPIEQVTWAPGEPLVIDDRLINEGGWIDRVGARCVNLYLPPALRPGDPEQAGPWLDHVRLIYPDDADHIIRYLAHRVQRPHEKINHALYLGGAPGIGKDSLLEPVKRAIGSWNFREASPMQVMGRFNGFIKGVVLRISEAKDLGETDRFKLYEHMKAYTAAPPDVLRCDEKNIREYAVLNVCSVIYTSNYKAEGIYLPADDRRHYVGWSTKKKEDFTPQYWDKLWGWIANGGDRHVTAYLAQLDLTDFDPKAPPSLTEAFWDIVNAHRASEDAELLDTLEAYADHLRASGLPNSDFIERDGAVLPKAVTLRRITPYATGDFEEWLNDRRNRRVIPHRFEACDYGPVRNPDAKSGLWVIGGRREVIYAAAELDRRDQLAAARGLQ